MPYAKDTRVSPEKSMAEIRSLLKKHGATHTGILENEQTAGVEFIMHDIRIRFVVTLPQRSEFNTNITGARMGKSLGDQAHAKAIRQRWRALLLVIKAKLEIVELDIETFEQTFMSHIVIANDRTIGEMIQHQIETGIIPLLPPPN